MDLIHHQIYLFMGEYASRQQTCSGKYCTRFSRFLTCVIWCMGLGNRWNINTKYYTADVSVWMAHLHEGFDIGSLPIFDRLEALVMVFDISDVSLLAKTFAFVFNFPLLIH